MTYCPVCLSPDVRRSSHDDDEWECLDCDWVGSEDELYSAEDDDMPATEVDYDN